MEKIQLSSSSTFVSSAHFETGWNSQKLSMTLFVPVSSWSYCPVSSPQSRSPFPYSLWCCSPICCGQRSSTGCVPVFKWLSCRLHLLLFLSVCFNFLSNCFLVSSCFQKKRVAESWDLPRLFSLVSFLCRYSFVFVKVLIQQTIICKLSVVIYLREKKCINSAFPLSGAQNLKQCYQCFCLATVAWDCFLLLRHTLWPFAQPQ